MAYPYSSPANDKADATPTLTDHKNHHNALANALIDLLAELGSGPKGGSADLTVRLAALDALVALKAALVSPTFTGTPAAPTAAPGTNTTQLATTAFVTAADAALSGTYVALAGGTMTGDLVVPAEVYGAGWNGSNEVPTKNDLYDKIETISGGGGSGLTQEEIEDLLGTSFLQAGTNVTLTYGDNGAGVGTLTIDVSSLSTEQVQDIVGAMATDNSDLDWTYDDSAGTIVAVIKAGAVTNAMLAGSIALSKLATDPLARANHTGTQTSATISDLAEAVQDLVGAMATDGTTVNFTYDDGAGTLTAEVQGLTSADLSDFAEAVRDRVGATLVAGTGITITVDDPGDTVTIALTTAVPTTEEIQDIIGAMVSGNSETGITVTYDDTNGKLDFSVSGGGGTVDVVSNVATKTILGRTTAGSGDSEELTPDQTWDVLKTGLYVPRMAVVTSDVTHTQSNTTLSDVTGMAFDIGASATEIWFFEIYAQIGSASAAQDLKVGWSFPTAATMKWGIIGQGGSTTIAGFGATAAGADPAAWLLQTDTPAYGTGATGQTLAWAGWVFGGGTAGTVQFRFAQNTSTAADLKVKAGSLVRYSKIAA